LVKRNNRKLKNMNENLKNEFVDLSVDLSEFNSDANIMRITMILDRSGSMASIARETINNVNAYIESQKINSIKTLLTIILFDNQYDVLYDDVDIKLIEPLTEKTFIPRGSTALLDAIGKTINSISGKMLNYPNQSNLIVIITDGEENASVEYSNNAIKTLIVEKIKNGLDFVYLGANQDAFKIANSLNITGANSMNYSANSSSVNNAFANLSSATTRYSKSRSFGNLEKSASMDFFNDDERDATKPNL